jgi:2,4-dienoyl-CoA reductase (NADPH2)
MLRGFDEVIIATGVLPRDPEIEGQDGANVLSYIDVLRHKSAVGKRVAVVGAGGIGFDVAEYLAHGPESLSNDLKAWKRNWGVGDPQDQRGGLALNGAQPAAPVRAVVLLQRKAEKAGKRLGKTTGWIHRAELKMKQVKILTGVNYERIDPQGLHISFGEARENPQIIAVDTVVLCAGQVPSRGLADALIKSGITPHIIGGADVAGELDAKRAIDQGTCLAAEI